PVLLLLERLLWAAAVHQRERERVDAVTRTGVVSLVAPCRLESRLRRDHADPDTGRGPLLLRPEGFRAGRDTDGSEGVKIAVVGGGSTYTPELADGIARLASVLGPALMVDELTLIDPATHRLDVVGPFAARLFAAHGHPGRVTWTSNLDEGLDGASVV